MRSVIQRALRKTFIWRARRGLLTAVEWTAAEDAMKEMAASMCRMQDALRRRNEIAPRKPEMPAHVRTPAFRDDTP